MKPCRKYKAKIREEFGKFRYYAQLSDGREINIQADTQEWDLKQWIDYIDDIDKVI